MRNQDRESAIAKARRVLGEAVVVVYGLNSNMEIPAAMIDYGPGSVGDARFEASSSGPADGSQRAVVDEDSDPVALIERARIKHARVTFTPRALAKMESMGVDIRAIARKALSRPNPETLELYPDHGQRAFTDPLPQESTVKVRPDANELFRSLAEGGAPLTPEIIAQAEAVLSGDAEGMTREEARAVLAEAGFTEDQVRQVELEARRAEIASRYGIAEDDTDEATNGSRQTAWYWPVVGVARREGMDEEQLARIAMTLSNASLPEDEGGLRTKRIQAAAKQAIGEEISGTLATALSYAHRRQAQRRVVEGCDCRSRPDGRGRCVQPNGGKCKASHVREAEGAEDISQTIAGGDGMKPRGGAKKVGERGALTTVRESYASVNDAAKRLPALAKGNTQIWMARDPEVYAEGFDACAASGSLPDVRALHETHALLGTVRESHPDVLYAIMQKRKWSPLGEAKSLLERKGITERESLTVGDVIVSKSGVWFVDTSGFKPLSEVSYQRIARNMLDRATRGKYDGPRKSAKYRRVFPKVADRANIEKQRERARMGNHGDF